MRLGPKHMWPRPPLLRCQRDKLVFSIPPHRPTPNFATSWNAAPTDSLPVVRYDARAGERSLDLLRWGLVPHWAKDMNVGFANINAKAEGIETRPAFRDAFQRRRCLVPVDSFYELEKKRNRQAPLCSRSRDPVGQPDAPAEPIGASSSELGCTRRRRSVHLRRAAPRARASRRERGADDRRTPQVSFAISSRWSSFSFLNPSGRAVQRQLQPNRTRNASLQGTFAHPGGELNAPEQDVHSVIA